MGKVSERDIISFVMEFIHKACEINEELIIEGEYCYFLHVGKKRFYFSNFLDFDTVEDFLILPQTEMDVREFTDNDNCVAYLGIEGDLYSKLYGYDAWQEDIFGDGDEAEKLYDALFRISEKYGLAFEWAGGALIIYDAEEWVKSMLQ